MDPFNELLLTEAGLSRYLRYANHKKFFNKYASAFSKVMSHLDLNADISAPFDPWVPLSSMVRDINAQLEQDVPPIDEDMLQFVLPMVNLLDIDDYYIRNGSVARIPSTVIPPYLICRLRDGIVNKAVPGYPELTDVIRRITRETSREWDKNQKHYYKQWAYERLHLCTPENIINTLSNEPDLWWLLPLFREAVSIRNRLVEEQSALALGKAKLILHCSHCNKIVDVDWTFMQPGFWKQAGVYISIAHDTQMAHYVCGATTGQHPIVGDGSDVIQYNTSDLMFDEQFNVVQKQGS